MAIMELSSGVRIYYRSMGKGFPLIFLHGWAMTGEIWCLQEEFAKRYRVICPDLRGHGQSSAPDEGYSFQDFAADLAGFVAALHLEKVILVGWSMGAQIVLQARALLSQRLAGAVLVSGTPRFTACDCYHHGLPQAAVKGLAVLLRRDLKKTVTDFARGMFSQQELEGDLDQFYLRQDLPAPHAARESLETLAVSDLRAALPLMDMPVLLVHGDIDAICLPSASHYMKEHLPNARLEIILDVGHAPFLSKPEDFNSILYSFLDSLSCT